jgi:hypothetical protein
MRKRFMSGILALLASGGLGAAIATQTFNYQGQLTDAVNFPVNGTANLAFQIWDAALGGTSLWSNAQSGVPVNQGLFNVELPLAGALTGAQLNGNLWLEVSVNGQVMSPRKQLLASVMSLNANLLQGLAPNNLPNNIPVLDAAGKLLPSVVSAPFPLLASGAGAGYAIYGLNSNVAAGQSGVQASGFNGVSATAGGASGYGVYGASATGVGVQGASSSGVGLRGDTASPSSVALIASNPSGLGAWAGGTYGLGISASSIGLRIGGGALSGQSFSSPLSGIEVSSAGVGLNVANSGSNYAVTAVNSNSGFAAVHGLNPAASGVGVSGENLQASSGAAGFGVGVYGSSNSSDGRGVKGEALANSGSNVGVYGSSASPGGIGVSGVGPAKGVQGVASAAGGAAIYGLGQGNDSRGVMGESSGAGAAYGVQGLVSSSLGAGVLGSGPGYGVWGSSTGSGAAAYGVYGSGGASGSLGEALNASGPAWGVVGRSLSPDGTGVQGQASGSGPGVRAGVSGLAPGLGGQAYGVYGKGANTGVYGEAGGAGGSQFGLRGFVSGGGDNRFGVYASVAAAPGELVYAVFGELTDNNNSGVAVVGNNTSPSGRGILASNQSALDSGDAGYALGVDGKFKVFDDNAGTFEDVAGPSQTSWFVPAGFCGAGNAVVLTPRFNINVDPSGAPQNNALWVETVVDGGFTVRTDKPVRGNSGNFAVDYLVIAR